jgi:predicted small metal-binding protein
MGKMLSCRDVGVNCDFEMHGKDEAEILRKAAEHAKSCHSGVQMTPALQAKIKSAIKEEGGGGCCGGHSCG